VKKFIMLLITVLIVGTLVFAGCAGTGADKGPQPIPKAWHIELTPEMPSPTVDAAGKEQLYGLFTKTLPADTFDGLMVKPDGTPYRFVYSASFLACDFMTFGAGVFESLVGRAGGEAIVIESGGMLERNIANMEDCTAMGGIDAVLTQVDDPVGLAPAIERAADAGIAVFGAYDEAASDRMLSCAGRDYSKQGEQSGEWLVDYVEKTGEPVTVYMLHGILGCPAGAAKPMGFRKAVEGHPLITTIEGPECLWSPAEAGNAVIDMLPTRPEINVVLDMGSMTSGIVPALETIGKLHRVGEPGHIIVLSHDGPPATVQALKDGYSDVVVDNSPWEGMQVSLMAAIKYVCLGETVDRYYFMPYWYVTEDNCNSELLWGNVMGKIYSGEMSYDDLPILDTSQIIQFP